MTRTLFRPLATVGLAALGLIPAGCQRTTSPGPGTTTVATTTPAQSSPAPTPVAASGKTEDATKTAAGKFLADWWNPQPGCVLVISGEQNGYLQPCGCTDGQLGGLGRRFDLINKIRALKWPVVGIDLGDLIHNPGSARGGFEQEKVKFGIALKALAAMKYAAVGLGLEDLKLGVMETMGQLLNTKEPRFVSSNVKPTEGFEETVRPWILHEAGPVKVGITSVLDPNGFASLADPDKASLLTVRSADEALPGVLDALKGADVRVLLVQGPPAEARRLAEKFPAFEVVVSTSLYADPIDTKPVALNGGKTWLIEVGKKGKYVGLVGVFPGSNPPLRYRRQPLNTLYTEVEPMRALIDEEYQNILRSIGVVENFPRRPNVAAPTGATYVGAESCQGCHKNTYNKWATTKHAQAYPALLRNPKRNREFDAECISCHTTGFGFDSGWVSAATTPWLKGNQCENCHGPASKHIAEPDNLAFRKPMALTSELADKSGLCVRCHDEDNDHEYSFGSRYAAIVHKGLDRYDDPKVHQGVTPAHARTADTGTSTPPR